MGQSLKEIAQVLHDTDKKVQIIYAFNGVGKTRLSCEFKELISPKSHDGEVEESKIKVLYYNAFTEDLFYWDNDLYADSKRKLKIQPNSFTDWILKEQGQERNIVTNFQRYTSNRLTPRFNEEYTAKDVNDKDITIKAYSEITFSVESGNEGKIENIKISKGEESCLVWCVFYSLLEQVIGVLNVAEDADRETDQFNELKYVFIDDPVSSLDENHLIELAVNIAELVNKGKKVGLKFILTTHNPLFYNVLYNELSLNSDNTKKKGYCCFLLKKVDDGSFELEGKQGDSNKAFSYHIHIKNIIEDALETGNVSKYHFMLLRNLYEKTACFLDYPDWKFLLPEDGRENYYKRIMHFSSHSSLSNEEVAEPTEPEKETVRLLLKHLVENKYYKKKKDGTI